MEKRKFNVGDMIEWCDEISEVLETDGDYKAVLMNENFEISKDFTFNFCGESAKLRKDISKFKFTKKLIKKNENKTFYAVKDRFGNYNYIYDSKLKVKLCYAGLNPDGDIVKLKLVEEK